MKKVLFVAVLAAFCIGACKDQGPVVAKVGGTKITEATLQDKLVNTPPAYQNYVNTPLGRKQFVDAVVRETIMVEAAKQAGVDKRNEYTEAIKEFKTEQERQYKEYKDALLIETYLREVHNSILASEADVEAYYEQNKEMYDKPVAFTVRHILLADKADAEAAYAELEAGTKFETVVQEYSQDRGSVQNGGLVGPFKRGEVVPEFEKAALELKNGEMSAIVDTPFGYHIIYKVSEETLPAVSFDDAKADIKRTIERERFDTWFESTKQKLGVDVNYELPKTEPEVPVMPEEDITVLQDDSTVTEAETETQQ